MKAKTFVSAVCILFLLLIQLSFGQNATNSKGFIGGSIDKVKGLLPKTSKRRKTPKKQEELKLKEESKDREQQRKLEELKVKDELKAKEQQRRLEEEKIAEQKKSEKERLKLQKKQEKAIQRVKNVKLFFTSILVVLALILLLLLFASIIHLIKKFFSVFVNIDKKVIEFLREYESSILDYPNIKKMRKEIRNMREEKKKYLEKITSDFILNKIGDDKIYTENYRKEFYRLLNTIKIENLGTVEKGWKILFVGNKKVYNRFQVFIDKLPLGRIFAMEATTYTEVSQEKMLELVEKAGVVCGSIAAKTGKNLLNYK